MKQITICHEYGLKIEPNQGQLRQSVSTRAAFSRFFQDVFVSFVIQKAFFGI